MTGRKKLSGQAALSTNGDGWSSKPIFGPWTYAGVGPKDGPDVVLRSDVEAGDMWDDITRVDDFGDAA